jgi:hypothetical protein
LKVKTTVEIPDELHRRVKAEAATRGCRLRDIIEEGLHLVLETQSEASTSLAELMRSAHGVVNSGVPDLGSNDRHLAGFGRDARSHY